MDVTTVTPFVVANCFTHAITIQAMEESKPEVGSSRNNIEGCEINSAFKFFFLGGLQTNYKSCASKKRKKGPKIIENHQLINQSINR
jgi:hypothetical protein